LKVIFEQKYWGLVLLSGFLVSAGITLLLYFRNKEEFNRWQQHILMVLRFLTVFFISVLFTVPLIKTIRRITEYPVVLVAVDNSLSMKGLPGTEDHSEALKALTASVTKRLEDKYKVVTYSFGEKTIQQNKFDFSEKWTDYSQMLKTVYENHFNENIGALVVIGDGNYNHGENPQNNISKFHFPVYTLGVGDTTSIKDARISDVRVNKTAFAGNQFPVEADIRITGLQDLRLALKVLHNGKELYSKYLVSDNPDYFITLPFTLEANPKGLQSFTVRIESAPGEQNVQNNSWPFTINILENKQKILILSEGSHPDIGALKDALDQQINYDISLFTAEPYPAELKGYNLIVLNQLPSTSHSCVQIIDQARKYRIPLLILIGMRTMLPQINMLGLGVEIKPLAGEFDDAQVSLNEQFVSFTLSDNLKNNLLRYPPLKVPFAEYVLDAEYENIAFQRIKNITTPKPLIVTGTQHGTKTGIIFGEGIWRWRLFNYILSGGHAEFNELMDKFVQYLALHDNDDNFIIDFKPVYMETENILMSAEVYNDAFEMINTPEVSIVINDSINRDFNYSFDHSLRFYRLNAGVFPPGKYHFKAATQIGSSEFTENGEFFVAPVNLEQIDYQANHRMLFQMAHGTNGRFYEINESDSLTNSIIVNNSIKTTNYFQSMLKEILNLHWIFFVLLLFLTIEWFLRKFWGVY
jgi:hypothetical protein